MPDLQSMNKAQREAVTRGEGPLLLLAGPGSGKTFTIVNRILFLIEQGIPPEKILVVTFTKEAAISMQCRFRRISDQFYPVNFGTFHSVFYHILKESGGFRHKSLILDSQKKKLLIPILKHINEKTGDNTAQEEEDVLTILSAISFYKNTGNLEKATEKLSLPVKTNFTEIWKAYCAAMSEEALADFDDMLFECRKLLKEDRREAEYWRKRFSHILIDEFQDINPVQYEVLKLLSEKPNNIFAVGDDDQSIYGFRGSNPELMRRFEEEFCAEKLLLNINYRCGKEILDASSAVIRENRNRFVKEFKSAPGKEINSGSSGSETSNYFYLIDYNSMESVNSRDFTAEKDCYIEVETYANDNKEEHYYINDIFVGRESINGEVIYLKSFFLSKGDNLKLRDGVSHNTTIRIFDLLNKEYVYNTEEKRIGKWIDGKPVYQKTLTGTSTQGIYKIDVSSLSIEHIVDYNLNEMLNTNGNDNVYSAYYGSSNDYLRLYYNNITKEIIFVSGATWSYGDYSLTLQYTKTTD